MPLRLCARVCLGVLEARKCAETKTICKMFEIKKLPDNRLKIRCCNKDTYISLIDLGSTLTHTICMH